MKELTYDEMSQIYGGDATIEECVLAGIGIGLAATAVWAWPAAFMSFVWVSENCFGS